MSSLQVDNIQTYSSNPPVIKNVNGTEVGTFCRAWVNFNGTSTVAIRASFNVSSITDNGTGDYTVNFTTAMPDANYVLVASSSELSGTNATASLKIRDSLTTPATTNIRVSYVGTSYLDPAYAMLAIFR